MGPRSHERGNLPDIENALRENLLQWGRVLTNAETGLEAKRSRMKEMLQWGRVLTNAETFRRDAGDESPNDGLQWGRVLTNAETAAFAPGTTVQSMASMGPRSHERGNGREPSSSRPARACFNGAAFSRTRKQRQL